MARLVVRCVVALAVVEFSLPAGRGKGFLVVDAPVVAFFAFYRGLGCVFSGFWFLRLM